MCLYWLYLIRRTIRTLKSKRLLDYRYHKARRFVELDDLGFHDIRHVSKNMFRKSVEYTHKLKTISGHKSDRVLNRYIYVPTDELKEINWNFN